MLSVLPQLIVGGLATGMMYALIALSMTVVYRATTVVNFGHGDLVTAGAYAIFVFSTAVALPFVPALLMSAAAIVRVRFRSASCAGSADHYRAASFAGDDGARGG